MPRNRGAVAHWVPQFGMPLKIAQVTRNSNGLNQIGSVCASTAKRDFASKLSRLLTAFCNQARSCAVGSDLEAARGVIAYRVTGFPVVDLSDTIMNILWQTGSRPNMPMTCSLRAAENKA